MQTRLEREPGGRDQGNVICIQAGEKINLISLKKKKKEFRADPLNGRVPAAGLQARRERKISNELLEISRDSNKHTRAVSKLTLSCCLGREREKINLPYSFTFSYQSLLVLPYFKLNIRDTLSS